MDRTVLPIPDPAQEASTVLDARDPAATFAPIEPRGIEARGEARSQFHHVVDVAPTVLEVAGVPVLREVHGREHALVWSRRTPW